MPSLFCKKQIIQPYIHGLFINKQQRILFCLGNWNSSTSHQIKQQLPPNVSCIQSAQVALIIVNVKYMYYGSPISVSTSLFSFISSQLLFFSFSHSVVGCSIKMFVINGIQGIKSISSKHSSQLKFLIFFLFGSIYHFLFIQVFVICYFLILYGTHHNTAVHYLSLRLLRRINDATKNGNRKKNYSLKR